MKGENLQTAVSKKMGNSGDFSRYAVGSKK